MTRRSGICSSRLVFGLTAAVLSALPAHAFKPGTHIWVGQQVLNDLADGCLDRVGEGSCVTITICSNERDGLFYPWSPEARCRDREYLVKPEVANALLRHPDAYRAGHVGPDAFPDLVVGQTTAHPGRAGGWKTDDWLRWMLRYRNDGDSELSFAYGYVGHAAGDIFAHTYVNAYAGGAFDLLDGEQTIERRHIALEDFIDRHNPVIRDALGRLVPEDDLLRSPDSSLARRLVLNDEVDREYRGAPTARHLSAMYGVVRAIEEALKKTDFGTLEWRFLDDLRRLEADVEATQLEVDALVSPIARALEQIDAARQILAAHEALIEAQRERVEEAARQLRKLADEKEKASRLLESLPEERRRMGGRLSDLESRLADEPRKVQQKVKREVCKELGKWGFKKLCDTVTKVEEVTNQAHTRLQKQVDGARDDLKGLEAAAERAHHTLVVQPALEAEKVAVQTAAEAELSRLEHARTMDEAGQKALDVASTTLAELEARRREMLARLAAIHSQVDLLMGPLGELRQLRRVLRTWQADATGGVAAYMEAGRLSALEILRRGDPLEPYSEWLSCWAPAFTGIPSPVSRSGCALAGSVEDLLVLIAETRQKARDAYGQSGGWVIDPLGKLEEEVHKVLDPAIQEAALRLAGIAGEEWESFARLLVEDFDDENVNEVFATDGSGRGLLLLPDVADRVRRDMAMNGTEFSPLAFSAAHDAVVLTKLTLLDASELNRLARDCGWWPNSHWGEQLFQTTEPFNVLLRAVRSIDGDHQWNPFAPPWPRRSWSDGSANEKRAYGRYPPDGFRLWLSRKARVLVFLGIFRGPLTPGLLDALPAGYPYRPSQSDPFPVIPPDPGVD